MEYEHMKTEDDLHADVGKAMRSASEAGSAIREARELIYVGLRSAETGDVFSLMADMWLDRHGRHEPSERKLQQELQKD